MSDLVPEWAIYWFAVLSNLIGLGLLACGAIAAFTIAVNEALNAWDRYSPLMPFIRWYHKARRRKEKIARIRHYRESR